MSTLMDSWPRLSGSDDDGLAFDDPLPSCLACKTMKQVRYRFGSSFCIECLEGVTQSN